MFRMCDPGAHVPGHLFQFHSAHVPAVAQPPQAIAEPAHVRFRQTPVTTRKQDHGPRREGDSHVFCARREKGTVYFSACTGSRLALVLECLMERASFRSGPTGNR